MKNINVKDLNDDQGLDFWDNFKAKLLGVETFPSIYTFKFIVPNVAGNKETIEKIFEHPSTKIDSKDSKSGRYHSITVKSFVQTVDEVIRYYKEVGVIEKVIML